MKCPFNCENKNDMPEFDTAVEHLVMVMNRQGHIHVHGPIDSEWVIRKFFEALVNEAKKNGITLRPATQDTIET